MFLQSVLLYSYLLLAQILTASSSPAHQLWIFCQDMFIDQEIQVLADNNGRSLPFTLQVLDPYLFYLNEVSRPSSERREEYTYEQILDYYCNGFDQHGYLMCLLTLDGTSWESSELNILTLRLKHRYCEAGIARPAVLEVLKKGRYDPLIRSLMSAAFTNSGCNSAFINDYTLAKCSRQGFNVCFNVLVRVFNAVVRCVINEYRQMDTSVLVDQLKLVMNPLLEPIDNLDKALKSDSRLTLAVFGQGHLLTAWDIVLTPIQPGSWVLHKDKYMTAFAQLQFHIVGEILFIKIPQVYLEFTIYAVGNYQEVIGIIACSIQESNEDIAPSLQYFNHNAPETTDAQFKSGSGIEGRMIENSVYEIIDQRTASHIQVYKTEAGVQMTLRMFRYQVQMANGILTSEMATWKSLLPAFTDVKVDSRCRDSCYNLSHTLAQPCRQDCISGNEVSEIYQRLQEMILYGEANDEKISEIHAKWNAIHYPMDTTQTAGTTLEASTEQYTGAIAGLLSESTTQQNAGKHRIKVKLSKPSTFNNVTRSSIPDKSLLILLIFLYTIITNIFH